MTEQTNVERYQNDERLFGTLLLIHSSFLPAVVVLELAGEPMGDAAGALAVLLLVIPAVVAGLRLCDLSSINRIFVGILLCSALAIGAGVAATPAAAQTNNTTATNTTYYGNASTDVANESWLAGKENATLEDQVSLLTRLSTMVVGSGGTTQGGGGPAGVLVFGFVLLGVGVAAVGRASTGAVGGATLSIMLAGGIVELGFVPRWMWAVVLLGIGLVLTAAVLRATR